MKQATEIAHWTYCCRMIPSVNFAGSTACLGFYIPSIFGIAARKSLLQVTRQRNRLLRHVFAKIYNRVTFVGSNDISVIAFETFISTSSLPNPAGVFELLNFSGSDELFYVPWLRFFFFFFCFVLFFCCFFLFCFFFSPCVLVLVFVLYYLAIWLPRVAGRGTCGRVGRRWR